MAAFVSKISMIRTRHATLGKVMATAFISATLGLSACGGGGSLAPASTAQPSTQSRPDDASVPRAFSAAMLTGLFVANLTTGEDVVLQNGTWKGLGTIQYGVGNQAGNWVDNKGNFFQTNFNAPNVVEYGENQAHPKFTYTGFSDPVVVSSDTEGNIFVGDNNFGNRGSVTQFKDGDNTPVQRCSVPGGVEGVAIDSNHDVFVAFNGPTGHGQIERFTGGLEGCNATTLGVQLGFVGGVVLDSHHNLIAADQKNGEVDVIEPPYVRTRNKFRFMLFQPFRLSLNLKENWLFVCESPHQFVDVLAYPSGRLLVSLGSANGISGPRGCVDEPNAVF